MANFDRDRICHIPTEKIARQLLANAGPIDAPWLWMLAFGHHEARPTHGYAATREGAMAPFVKSWRRE